MVLCDTNRVIIPAVEIGYSKSVFDVDTKTNHSYIPNQYHFRIFYQPTYESENHFSVTSIFVSEPFY